VNNFWFQQILQVFLDFSWEGKKICEIIFVKEILIFSFWYWKFKPKKINQQKYSFPVSLKKESIYRKRGFEVNQNNSQSKTLQSSKLSQKKRFYVKILAFIWEYQINKKQSFNFILIEFCKQKLILNKIECLFQRLTLITKSQISSLCSIFPFLGTWEFLSVLKVFESPLSTFQKIQKKTIK